MGSSLSDRVHVDDRDDPTSTNRIPHAEGGTQIVAAYFMMIVI
jgi:hypothetical protein